MTDREAMKMALEAFKISAPVFSPHIFTRAFKALEEALAQPNQRETSMTDLRKAANMALHALEFSLPAIEDFGSKEQLTDCHKAIMALYKSLAQGRTKCPRCGEVNPAEIHTCSLQVAQPEQKKESTAQTVDPRLLLGRSNNFTKETENRLCDIERRLAAIETQPALAQPELEPVAWLVSDAQGRYATIRDPAPYGEEVYEPLYAAPLKREWVGLTDEEREQATGWSVEHIEAKLKEKNNG